MMELGGEPLKEVLRSKGAVEEVKRVGVQREMEYTDETWSVAASQSELRALGGLPAYMLVHARPGWSSRMPGAECRIVMHGGRGSWGNVRC